MRRPEYRLDDSTGAKATLGLIVLAVDETIEMEVRRLLPMPSLAIHVSRVWSGADLTPETIAAMGKHLPQATSLLPKAPHNNAIAYACTSGATLLGPDRVAELVRGVRTTDAVLDPMSAVIQDCKSLRVANLGLVTPYTADIARPVSEALAKVGIAVVSEAHFGEAIEANVARISAQSIAEAARQVAKQGADAVFLSCTNLRTLDLISSLEEELGVPVLSSNLCLARALGRAAGVDHVMPAYDGQIRPR